MLRLKYLREKKGVSQKEVAIYINKTPQSYSLYEQGKRDPDTDTLKKLADFFETTTDYLLGNNIKIDNAATPSISEEDLALLGEIKNLSPEERKGLELFFDLRKQTNKNQTGSN